jgi:hypothetical protein
VSVGGFFDRLKPARKLPAARRRAEKSEALNAPSGGVTEASKLSEERDRLAREFVILQWDLGGLAYEMTRRDHFRLDVIAMQAAKLQQVDSSLGQAERMLRLEQEGVAGTCSSCGALQARGAAFCWQCGTELVASGTVSGQVLSPPPTPAGEPAAGSAPAEAAPPPESPPPAEDAVQIGDPPP